MEWEKIVHEKISPRHYFSNSISIGTSLALIQLWLWLLCNQMNITFNFSISEFELSMHAISLKHLLPKRIQWAIGTTQIHRIASRTNKQQPVKLCDSNTFISCYNYLFHVINKASIIIQIVTF